MATPDGAAGAGPAESPRRRAAAGWLLAAMLLLSIVHGLWPGFPAWLSGVAAWGAALLLWPRIAARQRIQTLTLLGIGIGCGLWGAARGAAVSVDQALGQNQVILAMLAAVSFLRLVNRPLAAGEQVPAGRGAFLRTLLGINVFGAAINITALVIIADRLASQAAFGRTQALMLVRGFCLAVMYSPFIGGMALALALAPGARLDVVALAGVPYTLLGLGIAWWLVERHDPGEVRSFAGYPIRFESLWLPVVLAVCVALLHRVYPALSVLTLISFSAPLLVTGVLWRRTGRRETGQRVSEHVSRALPEMSGELLLFLGAGVLAAGLTTLFASFGGWTPFERFDAFAASATLAAIVGVSLVGIHPIVCVSFLAPLLAPIQPEPNLLALTFVTGWAVGCTVNPFSGTNLTMQGRYGVSSWSITRWNLGYTALMLIAGWGMLWLAA